MRFAAAIFVLIASLLLACGKTQAPQFEASRDSQKQEPVDMQMAPVARVQTVEQWLNLIDQRPSAVTYADRRLVIDFRRKQALIHSSLAFSSPWRFAESVDQVIAGVLTGHEGGLSIPIDIDLLHEVDTHTEEEGGLGLAITLRSLAPAQSMTVLWQEVPLTHLKISSEWQRRTISIPKKLIKNGENSLRLYFRTTHIQQNLGEVAAAIQNIELGPIEVIREGPPTALKSSPQVHVQENGDVAMELASGTSIAYYLIPPHRGQLKIVAEGDAVIKIKINTDQDRVSETSSSIRWIEHLESTRKESVVDLSGYGNVPIRLEVIIEGEFTAKAVFHRLDIETRRAIPLDYRDRRHRDVYIFAVEGARADELLSDQSRGFVLPVIHRFLQESLVFTHAYTVSPWAIPSHATLLSSTVPLVHHTSRGTVVAAEHTLIPEILDRLGYSTVVASKNTDFSALRGLTQGFEHIKEFRQESGQAYQTSQWMEESLQRASQATGSQFVYIVLNEPQPPFDPPRDTVENLARPENAPLPHLSHVWLERVRAGKVIVTENQKDYLRALYRGELQSIDQALTQLLDTLERNHKLDASIIIFVGMHGEELFEHGGGGHGLNLFEQVIRIPFAIRAPQLLAPGQVNVPVDLLDVAPTLIDLLGIQYPDVWQGSSLVSVIDDPQPPPRMVTAYRGDGARTVIVDGLKFVFTGSNQAMEQRLFDLAKDPSETQNLLHQRGIALRILRTALAWELAYDQSWRRTRWGTGVNLKSAFALDHGM